MGHPISHLLPELPTDLSEVRNSWLNSLLGDSLENIWRPCQMTVLDVPADSEQGFPGMPGATFYYVMAGRELSADRSPLRPRDYGILDVHTEPIINQSLTEPGRVLLIYDTRVNPLTDPCRHSVGKAEPVFSTPNGDVVSYRYPLASTAGISNGFECQLWSLRKGVARLNGISLRNWPGVMIVLSGTVESMRMGHPYDTYTAGSVVNFLSSNIPEVKAQDPTVRTELLYIYPNVTGRK